MSTERGSLFNDWWMEELRRVTESFPADSVKNLRVSLVDYAVVVELDVTLVLQDPRGVPPAPSPVKSDPGGTGGF